MRILFVCTGNTCRSPMAEGILKDKTKGQAIECKSAGIFAGFERASVNAINIMKDRNIDISSHISTEVDLKLLAWADTVLTMTLSHKKVLQNSYPDFKDKVYTLLEYANSYGDISDPYGGDQKIYCNCSEQIEEAIEQVLKKIGEQHDN